MAANRNTEFNTRIETIKGYLLEKLGPIARIKVVGAQEGLISSKSIRNLKSTGEIPANVFINSPAGILIDVPKYLDWWQSHCTPGGRGRPVAPKTASNSR